MLGAGVEYDRTPYFFSDQYEFGMEYRGWAPSYDHVVFRGERASREFIAFWVGDDRVLAAMNANVWDQGEQLERLVRSNRPVDVGRLADPGVPLDDVVRAA
jgi:hypothetical protein